MIEAIVIGISSNLCALVFILIVNRVLRSIKLQPWTIWDTRFMQWNLAFIVVALALVGVAE